MEKLFGIIHSDNAHFYEMQVNNIEELISYLSKKLKYSVHGKALCNFYSHNVHDYGFYQGDISEGLCKVSNSKVLQRTKKTIHDSEDIKGFGVVEFDLEYESQIAKAIENIFNSKIKFADFTKLLKMSNYFSNLNADFSNSKSLMRKEGIYLNNFERNLSKEEFSDIIEKFTELLNFRYIGSISKEDLDDSKMKFMYKSALKNSALNDDPAFKNIADSINGVVDVKLLKKQ